MRIRMNPIVKKDLRMSVRSMHISWGLFVYEAALTVAFLLAMLAIRQKSGSVDGGNIYSGLVSLFPVIGVVQVCIVALYIPIITASSIAGERERQTFDIMMTTCMTPFSIVFGKMLSVVVRILFFVAASTPIMAVSFVVGGLGWINLFYYLIAIILFSLYSGSIGIFASACCRKSVSAVLMSFIIYFVLFFVTFVPAFFRIYRAFSDSAENLYAGESMLVLLVNPIIFFEEFFMQIMTGESFQGVAGGTYDWSEVGLLTYILARGKVWMIVSALCILLLSFAFMALAAWKINPMHSGSGSSRDSGKKAA